MQIQGQTDEAEIGDEDYLPKVGPENSWSDPNQNQTKFGAKDIDPFDNKASEDESDIENEVETADDKECQCHVARQIIEADSGNEKWPLPFYSPCWGAMSILTTVEDRDCWDLQTVHGYATRGRSKKLVTFGVGTGRIFIWEIRDKSRSC